MRAVKVSLCRVLNHPPVQLQPLGKLIAQRTLPQKRRVIIEREGGKKVLNILETQAVKMQHRYQNAQ